MKVWLASYPRSGNTFLRIVLNSVFGLGSYSLYNSENDVFNEFSNVTSIIGHNGTKLDDATVSDDRDNLTLIKTHEPVTSDDMCIYIVRDGRMAVVSYFHYLKDYWSPNVEIADVITGRLWPGLWAGHVQSFDPTRRPRTLLLRYEDLRDNTSAVCQFLAAFLQKDPLNEFSISFEELKRMNPKFFRAANDAQSLQEIQPYIDLFMEHNGDAMRELGYA